MTLELTPVEVLINVERPQTHRYPLLTTGASVVTSDLLEAVMIANSGGNRSAEMKASAILKAIAVALRHQSMDSRFAVSPLGIASWLVAQYIESQAIGHDHEH